MATSEEVYSFLQDFKVKLGIWGVVFRDDRGKNAQTLLSLEITPVFREKILKELEVVDYAKGPITENLNGGASMWVFGKIIKGQEVYIKITLGISYAQVLCISFHIAEHAMKFPLKN
ncbi:MAG: hypothetical protein J0I84_11995 [Terrimonas sp.]|nr:hypothetical protein [Terrimonas sp.]OJY80747.1 MAG: toxin [Sphingobacteriales bacterium 40-81]